MAGHLTGKGFVHPCNVAISIRGDDQEEIYPIILTEHGVKSGWANWPFDFDPVWVETCIFFEKKG